MCVVFQASASHSDMLAKMLGAQMPVKSRRSISCASSMVRRRRDGTATRLMAGSGDGMAGPRSWDACGVIRDPREAEKRCAAFPPHGPVLGCGMQRVLFCLVVGIGI